MFFIHLTPIVRREILLTFVFYLLTCLHVAQAKKKPISCTAICECVGPAECRGGVTYDKTNQKNLAFRIPNTSTPPERQKRAQSICKRMGTMNCKKRVARGKDRFLCTMPNVRYRCEDGAAATQTTKVDCSGDGKYKEGW